MAGWDTSQSTSSNRKYHLLSVGYDVQLLWFWMRAMTPRCKNETECCSLTSFPSCCHCNREWDLFNSLYFLNVPEHKRDCDDKEQSDSPTPPPDPFPTHNNNSSICKFPTLHQSPEPMGARAWWHPQKGRERQQREHSAKSGQVTTLSGLPCRCIHCDRNCHPQVGLHNHNRRCSTNWDL